MKPFVLAVAMLPLVALLQVRGATIEVFPPDLRGAIQPQLALALDGAVYVAFGRTGTVYCVSSRDGGERFKAPSQVGSLPKLALGMRRGPRIAIGESGPVISAISHADGNLYVWRSGDQGETWSEAQQVNSVAGSAREGLHAMTGDGKASLYVAWLDLRNGKTELWLAASHDGGRNWGANRQVYRSPDGTICECCHPSLALDGRGRLWVMWRNWLGGARDMFACFSDDQGKTFSPARKMGTGTWSLKGCPMDGGQLAVDGEGRLLTVWRREKAVIAAGETGETLLSTQGLHPVVATGRDKVFYLWQSGSKLMLKRGEEDPALFAANGAFPVLSAAGPEGPIVAAWETTTNGLKTIVAGRLD